MQLFNSQNSLPHKDEIASYLKSRKSSLEHAAPVVDVLYWGSNQADDIRRIIEFFDRALEELDNGNSINVKVENLKHYFSAFPEMSIFRRDIESLLTTGRSVLPMDMNEIPRFLNQERLQQEIEIAQSRKRQKEAAKAVQLAKEEEQKAQRRKQLADELGINLEQLTK